MSPFDDDVAARPVDGPAHYSWAARGPVLAAPVTVGGRVEAYLFHADDPAQDAAGLVRRRGEESASRVSAHWYERLRELAARGVPAGEAVRSLLGAAGPAEAGTVGPELQAFADKAALDAALNPPPAQQPAGRGGRSAQQPAGRGGRSAQQPAGRDAGSRRPSRAEIDAALRGTATMTPAVREVVMGMDDALAAHPTPDAVVVAVLPGHPLPGLVPGARVYEPAFLVSYLAGADHRFSADPVIRLRVPAGIPALFQNPAIPGEPGTLLLGRGIEWEVDRIVPLDGQTFVTGHVVDRRPAPLIG